MKRKQILLLVAVAAMIGQPSGLEIETQQEPSTLSGLAADVVSRFIQSPHFPSLVSAEASAGERSDERLEIATPGEPVIEISPDPAPTLCTREHEQTPPDDFADQQLAARG